MKKAKPGDKVSIDYEGVLENGEVFESTSEIGPLEFTIGTGSVMPAFELAIVGLSVNESTDIVLSPTEGYGERQQELLQTLDKSVLGESEQFKVGQIIQLNVKSDGKTHKVPATIIELADNQVTVDYNHPLAGHTLTYKVTVKSIEASKDPLPIVSGPQEDFPSQ